MRFTLSPGVATIALFSASISFPNAAIAMPDHLSKPSYVAPVDEIPAPQDIAYPGTMQLTVDATNNRQGIFKITQTIPVAKPGRLTLLYPKWLPGNHAPRGEIEKLAGLEFSANGQKLSWLRDDVDVYAFHVDIPAGVTQITAKFDFVSATKTDQGRIVMASNMLNLRWQQVSLYPAGYYTRQIPVQATAIYPAGWRAASALRPSSQNGSTYIYGTTDYDTLVDSPVFAGAFFETFRLSDRVHLNVVADDKKFLAAKPEQIASHRKLVKEAESLFGSYQYDRYDFLLALTDEMGGIGLEHHRSSENGVDQKYFLDWDKGIGQRTLLPHEMTHSWNGKYRRPADLWTPDFRQPTRDNLLWVYEGQTQFWGYVLAARSGMVSKQDTLDSFATIAASLDARAGRQWRPLIDTTHDPIIAARRPKPWDSWQRAEDYYNEGMLLWLEADQIIRRESGGKKSLGNFAKIFFGGKNGDWGVVTYDLPQVIATLNQVQPYDWTSFIQKRVYETSDEAPKNGLVLGGYRLTYSDSMSSFLRNRDRDYKQLDLSYSLGLVISSKGTVTKVIWNSPAFKAGLREGLTIAAVNGKAYSDEILVQAVADNKGQAKPIDLYAKDEGAYHNFLVDFNGGLRYPKLEKIAGEGADGGIDKLLMPQTQ